MYVVYITYVCTRVSIARTHAMNRRQQISPAGESSKLALVCAAYHQFPLILKPHSTTNAISFSPFFFFFSHRRRFLYPVGLFLSLFSRSAYTTSQVVIFFSPFFFFFFVTSSLFLSTVYYIFVFFFTHRW